MLEKVLKWLMAIDRRIIFILVALAVSIPLFAKFKLPVVPSPFVRKIYDTVENLPPRSTVLIAFDFDGASQAELLPMTVALLHHCFRNDHRVFMMTLWQGAFGLIEQAVKETAGAYGKKSGEDYAVLGYKPGYTSVIIGMGQDMVNTFPKDAYQCDTASMPVFAGVKTLRDMKYVIDIAAGNTVDAWIVYGREKSKFTFGAGCTGVMAPDCYPYLGTGQLNGLMGGLRGAADYEELVGKPGEGLAGMPAQSVTHVLVVLLIILGNATYLLLRHVGKGKHQ
jgi:hypothetical protein